MTQQERTQILEWIDKNTLRDLGYSKVVPVSTLTAFIESLSAEDEQDGTYKESDYLH